MTPKEMHAALKVAEGMIEFKTSLNRLAFAFGLMGLATLLQVAWQVYRWTR